MIFEQVATGGCQSYLIGCEGTLCGALIDPEISQVDRYKALAGHHGLHIRYVIDTHTHADHFSAGKVLARDLCVPLVMHAASPAPHAGLRLDDDDMLLVGNLRIHALHTPGHTADSMCLLAGDRVFTGDTLLFGGTGRTDLPTGDPDQLYDSLFGKLLKLDPALAVFPAHDYKGGQRSTLGEQIAENPRLQKRERDAYDAGHIPGARHLPRGQLELRIDQALPDPTVRVVTCCEFGKISTLAADTLRTMGYVRAVALDGGMKGWREAGYPLEASASQG